MEISTKVKHMVDLRNGRGTKIQRKSDHDNSKVDIRRDSDVREVVNTIGETVLQLKLLCMAAEKSARTNWDLKIKRYIDDEEVNNAVAEIRLETECYIRSRYPMAPEFLRSALVEANAFRLRRLCYQRSHPRRIGFSLEEPQTSPPDVQLPKIKESSPAGLAPTVLPEPVTTDKGSGQSGPQVPASNAATAQQAVTASTTKSTTEVPGAQPALGSNMLPCSPTTRTRECPYCGEIVELNTAKTWK